MKKDEERDPLWQTAWSWIQREHERVDFDDNAKAELMAWLLADPAHRTTYDKACRLWMLVGMVPPVNDLQADDKDVSDT